VTMLEIFYPVAATPLQIADELELPCARARLLLNGLTAQGVIERPRKGYYRWLAPTRRGR
jgi:hypothetical protein